MNKRNRTMSLLSISVALSFFASCLPVAYAGDPATEQGGALAAARRAVEEEAARQAVAQYNIKPEEGEKVDVFIEEGGETETTYTFTGQIKITCRQPPPGVLSSKAWASIHPPSFQATYSKAGRAVLGLRLLERSPRDDAEKSRSSSWW